MKILLKLYTRLNLGDDLFLKMICEKFPQHKFYLVADDEYTRINNWKNLTVIPSDFSENFVERVIRYLSRKFFNNKYEKNLQKVYLKQNKNVLKEVDAFVSIGGSIFIENSKNVKLDNEIAYYNLINKLLIDKPKFIIGCNFGPYYSDFFYETYREIFKSFQDICFREKYSYELFKELNNVRLAPDVVFALNIENNFEKRNKTVGFSIILPRNGIEPYKYYKKYSEIIEKYQEKGYEIYLFSFCKEEGDELAIREMLKFLKTKERINQINYDGDIDGFLQYYGQMEYMYCGRFHSMILSMLYNQKIYPIAYSNKMRNVLHDINYKGEIIEMDLFYQVKVNLLINQIEKNQYNIEVVRKQSIDQFLALEKIMK